MNYETFCELIRSINTDLPQIHGNSSLSSDLGLCSFDMMLLLFRIEELTDCKVDITLLKPNMTVDEFLVVINNR